MRFLPSRFRSTFIMAAVLLLLGLYVALIEVPQQHKEKEAEKKAEQLFDFQSDEGRTLLLHYPSSDIRLEKSDTGTWRLTEPIQAEADQREVQSLISTISNLTFTRVVEERVTNPAEYGLAHPNAEITLIFPDRNERLLIGDDGPMANSLYVERDSDQRVVLTQLWIKTALTKTVFDLRTKIVLPINHTQIDELKLEFPQTRYHLVKDGGQWKLKSPVPGPADEETLKSVALLLENLQTTAFMDPGPEMEKVKKSLKRPVVTVTLHQTGDSDEASRTARFYEAPEKDSFYVVTEPDKPIYRVVKASIDELKPDLFHYQDKRLLSLQTERVKLIEIRTPAEQYTLSEMNGDWTMKGENHPVNPDRVKRLLEQLQKLKAYQAPEAPVKNPSAVGLKPPSYEVRLVDPAGVEMAALRLGNELKGMLHAQGNAPLGIAMVNKDFLDEIPRKSELLKTEETAPPR